MFWIRLDVTSDRLCLCSALLRAHQYAMLDVASIRFVSTSFVEQLEADFHWLLVPRDGGLASTLPRCLTIEIGNSVFQCA